MKLTNRLTIILVMMLFLSGSAYAQFFEPGQDDEGTSNHEFFDDSGPNYNKTGQGGDEPELGEDISAENPGDKVPIDNWIFLLPLAGAAVGYYYLRRREETV